MTAGTTVDYNPFDPDFYTSDPFAVYRWMRDEAPVYRSERFGWYALTRFEDVRAAALDPDTFRSFEGMDIDDTALEQNPPGSIGNMDNPRHDDIRKVVSQVPDAQVMGDLDDTAAWAAKNGGDANKLAITGFCWGGRIVWLYAAHNPKLKAGVAWYGRVEGAGTELQPKNPADLVSSINAPVLGLYGGQDAGIPVEGVQKFKSALLAAGKKTDIVVYPDAPHGFHADYRPSYREKDAKDGWSKLLAWFKQNGVA